MTKSSRLRLLESLKAADDWWSYREDVRKGEYFRIVNCTQGYQFWSSKLGRELEE